MSENEQIEVTESDATPTEITPEVTTEAPLESGSQETVAPESGAEAEETVSKKDFNKAWYKKSEAEREREAFRRENEDLRAQLTSQTQTPQGDQEPLSREQFDWDDDKFNAAVIAREVSKQVAAAETKRAAEADKRAGDDLIAAFNEKGAAYAADNPEYVERNAQAAQARIEFSDAIQETILESDNGPALHDYLLSNPSEIKALNALKPLKVAAFLGRIEERMSQTTTTPEKKTTQAPNPITPVSTGSSSGNDSLDPNAEGISMEEMDRRQKAEWVREHGRTG